MLRGGRVLAQLPGKRGRLREVPVGDEREREGLHGYRRGWKLIYIY